MGDIFYHRFASGDPVSRLRADDLNRLDDILTNLAGDGIEIIKNGTDWQLVAGSGLPDGTLGDILYRDTDDWKVLPIGNADEVLRVNASKPDWEDVNNLVTHPSTTQTVVTDVQYDTTTKQLQKKTIQLTIQATGTESGWTSWKSADTENVVTDFQVDSTAGTLQVKTNDVYVLGQGTESGWTTKHTGGTC